MKIKDNNQTQYENQVTDMLVSTAVIWPCKTKNTTQL